MRADEFLNEGMFEPADHKGWKYTYDVEEYDDNRKIFHSATKDGKEVSMDWSPYSKPTDKEFALWIDLGMPTRKDVNSIGPLDYDDLMALAKTKQGTHSLLMKEGQFHNVPPATQDYMTKIIAKKIKPGLDPDGEEFEDQAYLYHTSQLGRQNLLAKGGNWRHYYDAIKWHYKNMNKSVEESRGHKIIANKLKTMDRLKKGISDEEWQAHQERMKKERDEYLKKHPESIYKREGLEDPKDNPCWKGYKPVGTKKKNGKEVPNCVPVNENSVTPLKDLEDYNAKKKALQDLQTNPKTADDEDLQLSIVKRLAGLEKQKDQLKN